MTRRPAGTLYWLPRILDDDRLDAVETLLLVALSDYVDADDIAWPSIETLAARARCSYPTARRRLASLAERGIIKRERRRNVRTGNLSTYEYRLVRTADDEVLHANLSGSERAPGSALASDHQEARAEPPRGEPPKENEGTTTPVSLPLDGVPPAPPPDPVKERAREIVSKVWERSDPKPATKFIAAVKIAETLLRAGHDAQAIGRAMLAVPTISTGWVEAEIRKSSGAAPSRRAPIDTDREAPEGRIDL